ncbi:hypothetical protein DEU56DRAFT_761668 [Suillus clintonianus]|uniref:uncharacterized protein n=1 Tax=Suillus clintonianus TaxID=1904413 RepID=UPI001B86AF72|nr:uncharacterized protein DEU56DRAFT_761668 [Suillus clintonianus]KAG2115475.1 hypothetical protein DEU56DRAFT_761668 [Suillus clintonianus]
MSKHAASIDDAPTAKRIRIDDGNQTEPLADKCARAILEQFLTTDMSYAQMEEALSSYLANRYSPDDWKESRDALFYGDSDDDLALTNLRAPHYLKNPYLDLDAEEDAEEEDAEEEDAEEEDAEEEDAEEEDAEEDEESEAEDHDHDGLSDLWKVTSMPGSSSAARFAAVIDGMTHRFEATQRSSSHDYHAIPSSISDLIPSVGLQDGRMYLLHVQRNVTDYITAHLRKRKFDVKVSAWIAGQLYMVADSPKTIAKSLPFSLYLAVKQYVRISDEEREVVECSYNKLPNPTWVRIKHGKYQGDIAQVFDSDLPNVSNINDGEEVVGFKFKGETYYMGLLLHNFHRDRLERVVCPHADDIQLHLQSGWNQSFLKRTVVAFSMQFLHVGDWARIVKGDLSSEIGEVTSTDHPAGSATLKLILSGQRKKVEVQLQDIERMFQIGDTVRVVAGPYLGVEGHLEGTGGSFETLSRPLPSGSRTQLFKPPPDIKSIRIGDFIEVLIGEHIGKCGIVRWLPKGGDSLWFQHGTLNIPVPISVVRRTHLPHLQTLQYMQDKGYDVKPGDVVRVARGPEYQAKGVVQSVDFPNARLTLLSDIDHSLVEVPISFVIKVCNASLDSFKKDIGQEVFIIGGDRKGYRAMLYSFTSKNCIVAVHGQQRTKIEPKDVATRLSVAIADPSTSSSMWTTSPDNPLPSLTAELNPWTVNSDDILDSIDARLDKLKEGPLAWLMKKEFFFQFTTHHVMLKVLPSFMGGRLHNRFVATACPDPSLVRMDPPPRVVLQCLAH